MPTATTRSMGSALPTPTLHLALDLGNTTWKLACATSHAPAPRLRTMPARDLAQLAREIAAAKARFGLPADAPVVSCYEAGRDGFWVHRALTALGVHRVRRDEPRRGLGEHHRESAAAPREDGPRRTGSMRARSSACSCATRPASAACGASCTCRASRTKIAATCTASSSRSRASARAR